MSKQLRFQSIEHDDDDDQEAGHHVVYKWEESVSSWNENHEHDDDLIQQELLSHRALEREKLRKAKLRRITPAIRRGLIRFLFIAMDCSSSAEIQDFRPSSRFQVCRDMLKKFIYDYFDQNPISQLGLMITRNRICERLTDLSGNPSMHAAKLDKILNTAGLASLQNTIILATSLLQQVPSYGQRELLIVYNSISTCDPGDIFNSINQAVRLKIKIHIISLAGEVYICKKITEMTGGSYHVALDSKHLQEIFQSLTIPPPTLPSSSSSSTSSSTTMMLQDDDLYTDLVYLGFPIKTFQSYASFVLNQEHVSLSSTSYTCPRCYTRTNETPSDCKVCGLQLNSSANIARSYHHLFPVPNYIESIASSSDNSNHHDDDHCCGCQVRMTERNVRLSCPSCRHLYCIECDLFIHEALHNCPSCPI